MPRTGFEPRAHGFHFANEFVDKVVTVPGYGEVATDGRSGGMAFAALDYWFAGLPGPRTGPVGEVVGPVRGHRQAREPVVERRERHAPGPAVGGHLAVPPWF